MDAEEMLLTHLSDQGIPTELEDFEHLEHRIMSDYNFGLDKDVIDPRLFPENDQKGWNPYEQDLSLYPEIFKVYGENFNRYEKSKEFFENEPLGQPSTDPGANKFRWPKDTQPWTKKYDDFMPKYQGTNMQ